jgi:hypothetical protein
MTNILAGESAGNNIDRREMKLVAWPVGSVLGFSATLPDVCESDRIGEMPLENLSAIFINLYLPNRFKSRPLKTQIKAAYSCKQTAQREPLWFVIAHQI